MNGAANLNDELFHDAPPRRLERALRLVGPGRPHFARRALLAMLVAWVPLAILSLVQLLTSTNERSFFYDFGAHARFLVALPALILAEAECIPRLGKIASHFQDGGLVLGSDTDRFQAAVSSTRRLRDSNGSEVVVLVLAYLVVAAIIFYISIDIFPAWHRRELVGQLRFSVAGWWHVLVSAPLLLVVLFGWLWRMLLWARFLFLMSRLNLHLIPGHPDHTGGLRFVSSSLRGFRLISFALGAIVAGSVANNIFHHGKQLADFKNPIIALVVFLLILFAGPLTIFLGKLRETKRRGVFAYGALAGAVGTQFEEKWLQQAGNLDVTSLEVPDFSATTDLYAVVANVYEMREVPFTLRNLIGPIAISAMIPFLPVALMALPVKVIVRGLAKLLF